MPLSPLTDAERGDALEALPAWNYDVARKALYRQMRFEDFAAALAAMVRIGLAADKADHHPEWTNVYNKLDIWLTTHDAGGVTERDLALARTIDALYPAETAR